MLELPRAARSRRGPTREAPEAWWAADRARGHDGANGVWGGKLMWGHVDDLVARARELPGLAGADLDDGPATRCSTISELIFVTRPDKVAQAVSLWRAVQTQ